MHGGIGMRFSNRISPIVEEIVNKTDRFIVILYRVAGTPVYYVVYEGRIIYQALL